MFRLESERLLMIPLDLESHLLFVKDQDALEKKLGLQVTGRQLPEELVEIFLGSYNQAAKDPDYYFWYTNWEVVLKSKKIRVAGLCFKGRPNATGEVEIGYGTEEEYQCQGYMTEALQTVINWALEQDGVQTVLAETAKENIASQRVLEKVGMNRLKEVEGYYWYHKT